MQEDLKQKQSQLDSKDLASTKQREELQSARKGFKLSEQEISKLRAELQKTKDTLSHQEQENQTLKRRLGKLSELHKEKVAELETRNEGILERENNAKGKVLTQTSQLEKQQKEIVTLHKKVQVGDEKKTKLVSDNARLREEIKSLKSGSSEELQKANAEIARLKQELAAKAPDAQESHARRSTYSHIQRSQAAAEQANFSVSKTLFKQQFYSYFDFNAQDGKLNLKSRLITDGYCHGYVNCELVARELKISYNAGYNCFFPVSKEVLDRKLDEYLERPRSQSSRQCEPIFSLIQILPLHAYMFNASSVNHGYSGNGRS